MLMRSKCFCKFNSCDWLNEWTWTANEWVQSLIILVRKVVRKPFSDGIGFALSVPVPVVIGQLQCDLDSNELSYW